MKDLENNNFFGEISFFSKRPRTLQARSKDIVEVLRLDRESFNEII